MADSNILPFDLGQKTNRSLEIWMLVDGFSCYEVSNYGRIKSLGRVVVFTTSSGQLRTLTVKEKILKGNFHELNGWCVHLTADDGVAHDLTVARVVLTVFDRPAKHGEVARHLDDNKHNQHLSNLAWGSYQDNSNDAARNGKVPRGSKKPNSKLTEEQALLIKQLYTPGKGENNMVSLAKRFGVSVYTVSCIINAVNWKHVGTAI